MAFAKARGIRTTNDFMDFARLENAIDIVIDVHKWIRVTPTMIQRWVPSAKATHIEFLATESASVSLKPFSVFRERMRELGWVEGDNLFVDSHWADGHADRLPNLTREALMRNPDVLVTLAGCQRARR